MARNGLDTRELGPVACPKCGREGTATMEPLTIPAKSISVALDEKKGNREDVHWHRRSGEGLLAPRRRSTGGRTCFM